LSLFNVSVKEILEFFATGGLGGVLFGTFLVLLTVFVFFLWREWRKDVTHLRQERTALKLKTDELQEYRVFREQQIGDRLAGVSEVQSRALSDTAAVLVSLRSILEAVGRDVSTIVELHMDRDEDGALRCRVKRQLYKDVEKIKDAVTKTDV